MVCTVQPYRPYMPSQPKICPGRRPLPVEEPAPKKSSFDPVSVLPPFMTKDEFRRLQDEKRKQQLERPRVEVERAFSELRKARTKVEKAAGHVTDLVFREWVQSCVLPAQRPDEWTQARVLYENYLLHAKTIGRNRSQRREVVLELATETQWGRMMAAVPFTKKRRTAGWYYPLRAKRSS